MTRTVAITKAMACLIESIGRKRIPLEYCAVLLGIVDAGDHIRVLSLVKLRNSDTRIGRFSVWDKELCCAAAAAQERGQDIVALLHTHTRFGSEASRADRIGIANAAHPWVIASVQGASGVSFSAYNAGSAHPLPVLLED